MMDCKQIVIEGKRIDVKTGEFAWESIGQLIDLPGPQVELKEGWYTVLDRIDPSRRQAVMVEEVEGKSLIVHGIGTSKLFAISDFTDYQPLDVEKRT